MRLFIPTIGTKLRFLENRAVRLFNEYRNHDAWDAFGLEPSSPYLRADYAEPIRILKDTILAVDRIYIKKGAADFDSITFTVYDSPNKDIVGKVRGGKRSGRPVRFWVKLEDLNGADVEIIEVLHGEIVPCSL